MDSIYKVKPSQIVRRDNGDHLASFPSRRQARRFRAQIASQHNLATYEVKIIKA